MPVNNNSQETLGQKIKNIPGNIAIGMFYVFSEIGKEVAKRIDGPQPGTPAIQKPNAALKHGFLKRNFYKIKSYIGYIADLIFANKRFALAFVIFLYRQRILAAVKNLFGIGRRASPSTITTSIRHQAVATPLELNAYDNCVQMLDTAIQFRSNAALADYALNQNAADKLVELKSISDPAKPPAATLKFETDKITAQVVDPQLIDTIISSMHAADPNLNTFTVNCENEAEAQSISAAISRHFPGNNISVEFRSTNPELQDRLDHLNRNLPGVPQQPRHTNNTSNGMYFVYGAAAMGAIGSLLKTYPDLPKQAFNYLPNAIKNRFSH